MIIKQSILKYIYPQRLDRLYYIGLFVILFIFLIFALLALYKPVNHQQQHAIELLSLTASNPHTQQMAKDLLELEQIDQRHYFKLIRTYQFENAQGRHYPALQLGDE